MPRTQLVTRTRNILTRIGKKGRVIIDHPVAVGRGGGRERGVVRGFSFPQTRIEVVLNKIYELP